MDKNLKKYIVTKFNEEQTPKIENVFEEEMNRMLKQEKTVLSGIQYKTASRDIFNRIAAYKAFRIYLDAEQAKEYFYGRVKGLRSILHFLNKTSLGSNIFKKIFVSGLKSDVLDSTIKKSDKHCLIFDINKCLYNDLCIKYGCGELTSIFCDGDHFMFDNMKKLKFQRTQTLGKNGELCDFHFINAPEG